MPVCAGFRNFFSRATFLTTDVSKSQSRHAHTHIIHRAHTLLSFFHSFTPSPSPSPTGFAQFVRSLVLLGFLQFFSILHVYMSTIRFRCPSSLNSKQREYDEQTTIPCARTTACGKLTTTTSSSSRKNARRMKWQREGKRERERKKLKRTHQVTRTHTHSITHTHTRYILFHFGVKDLFLSKHFSFLLFHARCYLSRTLGFERVSPRCWAYAMRGVCDVMCCNWIYMNIWIPTRRFWEWYAF